jgi:hypothetical protein
MSGPYTISRTIHGFARAIERDGRDVLHLDVGTVRNEENIEQVVRELNEYAAFRAATEDMREIKEATR